MTRPEALVSSEKVDSYGPAMSAVMYDEMRGVGSNRHVALPSPCFFGSGVGEFEIDGPRLGSGDRELEGRLEVGLLEDGEDAAGVGHLELRVEVDLAVDRVDEAVQALAGVGVEAVRLDDQLVLALQAGEGDARVVEGRDRHVGAVQRDACARRRRSGR